MYVSMRGGRFGVMATTGAELAGTLVTGAVFMADIFIESVSPGSLGGPHASARAVRLRSDVNTLDGQRLEVRRRIFGIEHLAVEEGLLAARLGGRDIGGGNAQGLGGIAPDVLTVDLGDQRLGVIAGFIFAPADILGEEPEIVTLERIRGV